MRDLRPEPQVPDLAMPAVHTKVSRLAPRAEAEIVEPSFELAPPPARAVTGVRSWPCPVCQCELPRDQRVCPECGERMFDEAMLVPYDHVRGVPTLPHARFEETTESAFWVHAADLLPVFVAKRLLLYPLLFAFFANLLVPCRFHSTGACLLLAVVGLVGMWANRKCGRLQ
jgi:hypothetical protein